MSFGEGPSTDKYAYPTSSYGRHNIDIASLADSSRGSFSKLTSRDGERHYDSKVNIVPRSSTCNRTQALRIEDEDRADPLLLDLLS